MVRRRHVLPFSWPYEGTPREEAQHRWPPPLPQSCNQVTREMKRNEQGARGGARRPGEWSAVSEGSAKFLLGKYQYAVIK